MKYIHATKGSIIAAIIFSFFVFIIPGRGSSPDVEIILTVSSFLFAILSGFYIARLNTRYNKVREFLAMEDAYWLSFYNTIELFGKKISNEVSEYIDKYYIVSYDLEIGKYYKPATKYFLAIYGVLNNYKKYRSDGSFGKALDYLAKIEENRNKTQVITSEERISFGQWSILILLASIIVFSMFFLKNDLLYSQIITILLSSVLILILLTLRDLQNLRLSGNMILIESGEEVLESIGKLRYYNKYYLDKKLIKIPDNIKKYRLGLHKPEENFNIKIIER